MVKKEKNKGDIGAAEDQSNKVKAPFYKRPWFVIVLLCLPLLVAGLLALPLLFNREEQSVERILQSPKEYMGRYVQVEGYVIIEAKLCGTDLGLLQLYAPQHIDVIFPPQAKGSFIIGDLARVRGKVMSQEELFAYVRDKWGLSPQDVLLQFLPSNEEQKVKELIHITPPDEYLTDVTPLVIWADKVDWIEE